MKTSQTKLNDSKKGEGSLKVPQFKEFKDENLNI